MAAKPSDWHDRAGIFLVAFAGLAFELLVIRCLSITMWYHLAFMVISVAMLGFGASGTLTAFIPKSRMASRPDYPVRTAFVFSLSMVFTLACLARLNPNLFNIGTNHSVVLTLGLIYLLLAIPFFFAGLTVALLLKEHPEKSPVLYGADLAGAGMGCLMLTPLFRLAGLPGAVFLFAAATALGVFFFSLKRYRPMRTPALVAAALLAAASPWAKDWIRIEPGPDKMLAFLSKNSTSPFKTLFQRIQQQISDDQTGSLDPGGDWPPLELLSTTWDRLCRIDVAAYPDRHAIYGIGMATTFKDTLPGQIMITQDGDAATFITRHDGDFSKTGFIDRFLYGLPYSFRKYGTALIIGAGGGADVLAALKYGSRSIHAIELNPATIRAVKRDHADFAGHIYSHPSVTVTVGEGRSVVRRSGQSYDLIQMTGVDTWASSSQGAYVLSENFLYTVEAFGDYYEHLNEGGILSIVRARFLIPRETLRLCSLAIEMLAQKGIDDPENRILVVTEPILAPNVYAGFMLKKGCWSPHEIKNIDRFCSGSGFKIAGGPGCRVTTPFSVLLASRERDRIYREYPFDIRPVTDNNPYFFKLHRWSHFRMPQPMARVLGIDLGNRPGSGHDSGLGILLFLLLQAVILSLILIIIPFFRTTSAQPVTDRWNTGIFFGGIGLGFMFIEITLIQHLTLFLGYPTRSITITLCFLLIGSGIGSLRSGTLDIRRRSHPICLGIVMIVLSTAYAFGLPVLSRNLLFLPDGFRMLLAAALVACPGYVMGFFFPLGVRAAGYRSDDAVGWAWCVNGCASVLGSILAAFISIVSGFRTVFLLGGLLYLIAGTTGRKLVPGDIRKFS
ncbi:hypothetical protein JXA40_12130 [bacterium]|nr:hypothetical protein [candidate division CSSED10-310 bacterium]